MCWSRWESTLREWPSDILAVSRTLKLEFKRRFASGAHSSASTAQGGPGDSDSLPAVMALLEAGYADKLLFSSDFSFASDLKRSGGAGYAMAVTVFGPKLRNAGVTQSTLHGILMDNPRRFLAFIPKMRRGA